MESNVTTISYQGKEIVLIGTAHVSKISAEQVKEIILTTHPDSVCIELDADRYHSITHPDDFKQTDIVQVIKTKKTGFLLANLILSSYQKRLAKQMDVQAGQEMIAGIECAKEIKAQLVLADRNIQTTFMRIWHKHSFWQKFKLMSTIFMSLFEDEKISEEDLEKLKESDMLQAALDDVSKELPTIAQVLIHERDQYLAYKIKNAPGNKIVAVLGAAHIPGILNEINHDQNIEELDFIPVKSKLSKLAGWIIPALIILLLLVSFGVNTTVGFEQIKMWLFWNGSLAAIGALLCLAHPVTILISMLLAPFTALNPVLAVGWFAGISEAHFRKPKVIDLENLFEATNSFKAFWQNRFTHILLVVLMTNLFCTIGTLVGGYDLIKTLLSHLF